MSKKRQAPTTQVDLRDSLEEPSGSTRSIRGDKWIYEIHERSQVDLQDPLDETSGSTRSIRGAKWIYEIH